MKKIKKLLERFKPKSKLVVILGVAIVLVILFFSRNVAKKKSRIQTTQVERQDLAQTISASGTVTAEQKVDLKFQTSGLLSWVGVKEGDYVKKWQAIAQLDKMDNQVYIPTTNAMRVFDMSNIQTFWIQSQNSKTIEQTKTEIKKILLRSLKEDDFSIIDFFTTTITLWSITLAFVVSAAIGVGFGVFPAYKAAKLNPIEAMRYE